MFGTWEIWQDTAYHTVGDRWASYGFRIDTSNPDLNIPPDMREGIVGGKWYTRDEINMVFKRYGIPLRLEGRG